MNNNTSLPVETLDAIVQELISELPEGSEDDKFLPRRQWQLAPLLYVSKLWHAVAERHMYKVISIGKPITLATEGEALETRPIREGFKVAQKLLETLKANPRLAACVEDLQLAIKECIDRHDEDAQKWTHINTHVLEICPNVKHFEVRGFFPFPTKGCPDFKHLKTHKLRTEFDNLVDVLKEKSLVSFRINRNGLVADSKFPCCELDLCDILPRWPNLKVFSVKDFRLRHISGGELPMPECPELQEINLVGCSPNGGNFDWLRSLSTCVTKLRTSVYIKDDREAFYKCLGTWSTSLTHLRIHVYKRLTQLRSFWAVVSTLAQLRELQIYSHERRLRFNFSHIVGLSKLERLCIGKWDFTFPGTENLEDPETFPALRHIICYHDVDPYLGVGEDKLKLICCKRNIKLENYEFHWGRTKPPGFVL